MGANCGGNNLETRRKRKPAPARSTVEARGHASAGLEQLEISARCDMADQGSPEVFCVVRMETKRWVPPRRPASARKWSNGDGASGPFILGSPDRKTQKKFRVDAASGQVLAV